MRQTKRCFVLLILTLFAMSCVPRKHQPVNLIKKGVSPEKAAPEAGPGKAGKQENFSWVQQPEAGSLIAALEGQKKAGEYLMNFDNIEIPDFIEAMMSGVFKMNYYMSDAVKGLKKKFSIKMTEDLKQENVFKLFQSILDLHNVAVTLRQNTYVFDLRKGTKLTLKGPIVYGRNVPSDLNASEGDEVVFLVPFYNISPEALKGILTSRLPVSTEIQVIKSLNLMLISGVLQDIRYSLSFIDLLDRAQFKEKSILMVSPKYWDIYDFGEKLKQLLEADGIDLKQVEESRSLLLIPLEKLNSLLVISSVGQWAERVLYWLKTLDVPEAAGESRNVYAYKLKNVEVDSVFQVIKEFAKEGFGTNRKSAPATLASSKAAKTKDQAQKINDNISVIPVKETNTLVIVASPVEYREMRDIIQKIDVPRNQVFVEVIIGEVTLDTDTQLGLEFWIDKYLYRTSFGTKGGLGVFKGYNTDGSNVIPTGSNAFLRGTLPGTDFEVLLNALVTDSKINIISTPKLTVAENAEAEITVGADVPVISSESGGYNQFGQTQPGGQQTTGAQNYFPYRSIQYISTGIILKVKAAILSDNKIGLDISQEISEAQENKLTDISSPEILKRTIKTNMIVKEGEIAFIGGLIQEKKSNSQSGIPVLSKIPLLGSLFRKSSKRTRKTELVVFINSKTIRKSSDMKEIVDGIKKTIVDYVYMEKEQ
jgi:general secretion pathway protein D